MNCGKTIFAQLMDFLPIYEFHQCVQRYHGNYKMKSFSCWDQFLCMAFAQLTYRESLRDIETCLRSAQRIFLLLAGCSQVIVTDTKVPRMTKEELKSFLGNPGIVVVDVRIAEDWKRSDSKIKGAFREDPEQDSRTWASKYPKDKTLVFYCA